MIVDNRIEEYLRNLRTAPPPANGKEAAAPLRLARDLALPRLPPGWVRWDDRTFGLTCVMNTWTKVVDYRPTRLALIIFGLSGMFWMPRTPGVTGGTGASPTQLPIVLTREMHGLLVTQSHFVFTGAAGVIIPIYESFSVE